MIILQLQQKTCMSHLLLKPTFDNYRLLEADITTFNEFHIDGFLQKDFFDETPESTYSKWSNIKDFCYQIIKGRQTPLNFKFVMMLDPFRYAAFLKGYKIEGYEPENIKGLFLNFHFNGTALTCTTGTSLSLFTMDKSIDQAWDSYIQKLFTKFEIDYELL